MLYMQSHAKLKISPFYNSDIVCLFIFGAAYSATPELRSSHCKVLHVAVVHCCSVIHCQFHVPYNYMPAVTSWALTHTHTHMQSPTCFIVIFFICKANVLCVQCAAADASLNCS